MNSLILRNTASLLITVLLLFSIFLLLRGHDLPGGGFLGGLMGASALALYAIANGVGRAKELLRIPPMLVTGIGLLAAVAAGLMGALSADPFLTSQWWTVVVLGNELKLSSPLLFDIGVYLVVVGVLLTMLFALEEH